ncbi:unnamed protein product [Thlaspi arvense]|uniref:Uncharacterized protein n=1 Tax=Thlaspi arvense TaxID=13288 RepID=A0AAU9R9I7_THLAR|nr:unnamed protein product [Thlaspi arvense]
MASQDSTNLIVGSYVSFTLRVYEEFFHGTVYFYDPEDGSFGIEDVSRAENAEDYDRVDSNFQLLLEDIKDLKVIREPAPKPTTNTIKDDEKTTTPSEASSSTSTSN